jgi:hypothetical protein
MRSFSGTALCVAANLFAASGAAALPQQSPKAPSFQAVSVAVLLPFLAAGAVLASGSQLGNRSSLLGAAEACLLAAALHFRSGASLAAVLAILFLFATAPVGSTPPIKSCLRGRHEAAPKPKNSRFLEKLVHFFQISLSP